MSTGVTAPRGFRAAAVEAGIKPDRLDLAVIACEAACPAAAVFTTNRAVAAPVVVSREHLRHGTARAVVVNAGCANAATGAAGMADAREMAQLTAEALGCPPREIVVASTGVIGIPLPMAKVRAAVPRAVAALHAEGGAEAARAIMTTDTRPKEVAVDFVCAGRDARVGAMAKGAGMIAPNMATMLAFFTTDVWVETALLHRALVDAVGASLNRITIDGDTSTNDMAIVLAGGASGARVGSLGQAYDAFATALRAAASRIAEMIVRDGEGATRTAQVCVQGARTAEEADRIARTVAESPLVKTALNGGDPNWGRILAAAGRAGVPIDVDQVDIHIGEVWVCENGAARAYDETAARRAFESEPAHIRIDLHAGDASGWMWTCDFSQAYVDINGSYRS